MCDNGHVVEFHEHACHIKNLQGITVLTGSRIGNTYKMNWKNKTPNSICMIAQNDQSWLWHKKLNHLNFKQLIF